VVLSHRRNASLGHGDTDDRIHPEQVVLGRLNGSEGTEHASDTIAFKLQPALVSDVQMSRLHSGMRSSFPHSSSDPLGKAHFSTLNYFLNSRNHRRIHHWHPRLRLC
jgi:hypothetical protein